MILAIDPGPEESAWVRLDTSAVVSFTMPNEMLLQDMRCAECSEIDLVVEMIASYGMPVGREIFETCVWIGRFVEAWEQSTRKFAKFVYRKDVKLHLCQSPRAKDANVRQALIDRYGGKDKAIGKKSSPGPLHKVRGDEWAALAVAVTYQDTRTIADVARAHLTEEV